MERNQVNLEVKKVEQSLKRLGEEVAQEVGVINVSRIVCTCTICMYV